MRNQPGGGRHHPARGPGGSDPADRRRARSRPPSPSRCTRCSRPSPTPIPRCSCEQHGLASIGDTGELERMVDEVIAQNPAVRRAVPGRQGGRDQRPGRPGHEADAAAAPTPARCSSSCATASPGDGEGLRFRPRGRQALPDHPRPDPGPARGRCRRGCTAPPPPQPRLPRPPGRDARRPQAPVSRPSTMCCSSPARARRRWSRRWPTCSRPATGSLVGSAGNFGERWLKLVRAYGIEPGARRARVGPSGSTRPASAPRPPRQRPPRCSSPSRRRRPASSTTSRRSPARRRPTGCRAGGRRRLQPGRGRAGDRSPGASTWWWPGRRRR